MSKCLLNSVKHVLLCVLHASAGEAREKRRWGGEGRGRAAEGGGGVGRFRRNADRLYQSTPPEVLHTPQKQERSCASAGAITLQRKYRDPRNPLHVTSEIIYILENETLINCLAIKASAFLSVL